MKLFNVNMWTLQLNGTLADTHTHIHTSNRTPPPVFTRVTGHPEIYIHGWKWKWNNQEGCPAALPPVTEVHWRGESDI